jgi:hypothetical protein
MNDISGPTIEEIASDFTYVDVGRTFPKAPLLEPTSSGYLLVTAEVDRRPMNLPNSGAMRGLIRRVKELVSTLDADDRVLEANVLDGTLAPTRPGAILKERPDVSIARFDLAVLVETSSPETASQIERGRGRARLWSP